MTILYTPLATFTPTTAWQFTEPTSGNAFQFEQSNAPTNSYLQVAQTDGESWLYEPRTLTANRANQLLLLDGSAFGTTRHIAIRSLVEPDPSLHWSVIIAAASVITPDVSGIQAQLTNLQLLLASLETQTTNVSTTLNNLVQTMPLNNNVVVTVPVSSSVSATTVASATTSTQLLASNTVRKGASIWNASTANLFIDLAATVTTAAYAVELLPGGYYELPFGYTGAISGIWSAANGSALVREFS
jgi:hypothetical protein